MSRPQVPLALAAGFLPLALLCVVDQSTTASRWIGRGPMAAVALFLAAVAVTRVWTSQPMRSALLALPLASVLLWRLTTMTGREPGAALFVRWTDAQFWADETTVALIVVGVGTTGLAVVHTEARLWVSRASAIDAVVVMAVTVTLAAARASRSTLTLILVSLSAVGLAGRGELARRAGISALTTAALLVPLAAQSAPIPSGTWPTPLWVGDGHVTPNSLTAGIALLLSLAVLLQGSVVKGDSSGSWLVRFGIPVWLVCGAVASTGPLRRACSERAAPGWTSLEQLATLAPGAPCEEWPVEGAEQWLLDGGTARKVYGGRTGEPILVAPANGRMDVVFSLAGGPLARALLLVRAGSAAGGRALRVCPIEVRSFAGNPLDAGCIVESGYVLVCSKGERSERLTSSSRNPWPDGAVVAQTGDVTSIFVRPDAGVGDTLRLVSDAKRLLGTTGPWVFSSLAADASVAVSLKRRLSRPPQLSVKFTAEAGDQVWIGYAKVVSTLWACRPSLPSDLVISLRVAADGKAGGVELDPAVHELVSAPGRDCLTTGLPSVSNTIGEIRAEVHWGDSP